MDAAFTETRIVSSPRIYIDTNIVLDFYRSASEPASVFDDLLQRNVRLVTTEQTYGEIRRNRSAILSQVISSLQESSSVHSYSTTLLRGLPEFVGVASAKDAIRQAVDEMTSRLKPMLSDSSQDPVLAKYLALTSSPQTLYLPTTDASVQRAHRRKLLGMPPTSPNKITIGDELIWETLLSGCFDDLVIVSRDAGFVNNEGLLKEEFQTQGRQLLAVVNQLSAALSRIGRPSSTVTQQEKQLPRTHDMLPAMPTHCTGCAKELDEEGYEGSDGDSSWWLFCAGCGRTYFPGVDFPAPNSPPEAP